ESRRAQFRYFDRATFAGTSEAHGDQLRVLALETSGHHRLWEVEEIMGHEGEVKLRRRASIESFTARLGVLDLVSGRSQRFECLRQFVTAIHHKDAHLACNHRGIAIG